MTKEMVNVTMYGDGSQKSIVTGSKNFVDGVRTFETATFGMIVSKLISIDQLSSPSPQKMKRNSVECTYKLVHMHAQPVFM